MKSTNTTKDEITIRCSRLEINFLCNAVNETLEALEDWEFHTRTGYKRSEASALLAELRRIADAPSEE